MRPVTLGAMRTAPISMPGTSTSMPNTALPSTLEGVSTRRRLRPIRPCSEADFMRGRAARGSLEASATISP